MADNGNEKWKSNLYKLYKNPSGAAKESFVKGSDANGCFLFLSCEMDTVLLALLFVRGRSILSEH